MVASTQAVSGRQAGAGSDEENGVGYAVVLVKSRENSRNMTPSTGATRNAESVGWRWKTFQSTQAPMASNSSTLAGAFKTNCSQSRKARGALVCQFSRDEVSIPWRF